MTAYVYVGETSAILNGTSCMQDLASLPFQETQIYKIYKMNINLMRLKCIFGKNANTTNLMLNYLIN